MILGPIMIATGLTGMFAMEIGYPVYKIIKGRKKVVKIEEPKEVDLSVEYTKLFTSLGLMNPDKGDWVKCLGMDRKEYYTLVEFKLSDTLKVEKFQAEAENITQKLNVIDTIISYEKGKMLFKARTKLLPVEQYSFEKTPKNLIPLGSDLDGNVIYWDLKKTPHAMIVGQTGCGKSNLLNVVINHIYNNFKGARLYLTDLKGGIEFSTYENTANVIAYSDSLSTAQSVIDQVEEEYKSRLEIMKEAGYRDYSKFINDKPNSSMKRAFFIIDEFGGLLRLNKKDDFDAIETLIDLSKRIRAVGMHLLLATQRPTTDNIPSDLKANIGCVVGMKTRDKHNSNLIIGHDGLEKLDVGEGICDTGSEEIFFKAPFIDDATIQDTVKRFAKVEDNTPNKQNSNVIDVFKK